MYLTDEWHRLVSGFVSLGPGSVPVWFWFGPGLVSVWFLVVWFQFVSWMIGGER